MRSTLVRTLLCASMTVGGLVVVTATSSSSPALAANGSISGIIYKGAGAGTPYVGGRAYATMTDGTVTSQATAGMGGAYTLSVPPGTYCVSFGTGSYDVTSTSFDVVRHCNDGAAPIVVTSASTRTGVDGHLHLGGLDGKVTRGASVPEAGAQVYANQVGGSASRSTTTDGAGLYALTDLPPGIYCVTARGADGASPAGGPPLCQDGALRATVVADVATPNFNLQLTVLAPTVPGGIAGKVTVAAGGTPVANRVVQALSLDDYRGTISATTAADGTYTITSLRPGQYCVRAAIHIDVALGAEVYQNQDSCQDATPVAVGSTVVPNIDLALDQGGAIAGTITTTGAAPFPNALIRIRTFDQNDSYGWHAETLSLAGGVYELAGLPAGQYCVTVEDYFQIGWATEAYPNATSCTVGASPVVVTRGATTPVNVELSHGGSIGGVVTVPAGQDVTKVQISTWGPNGQEPYEYPDATGKFTVPALTPGGYCQRFRSDDDADLVATTAGAGGGRCTSRTVGGIVVTDGVKTPVDVTMPQGGSVSGWLVSASGAPINSGEVKLQPLGPPPEEYIEIGHPDSPRPDGSFWIRGVPPGTYCLLAQPSTQGLGSVAYTAASSCAAGATPITVQSGQNVGGLLMTAPTVGSLTGSISFPAGHPANRASIELYAPGASTPTIIGTVQSESDTSPISYFTEAPPGSYCVLIRPTAESGLAPRAYPAAPYCGPQAQLVTLTANEITAGIDFTLEVGPPVVYVPLSEPRRLTDTRVGFATVDGVDAGSGVIALGGVHEVQVAGRAGVPSSAVSVVLNVTAVDASAPGFMTVWPCGVPQPLASSLNFATGQTVPNSVIAKVGAGGKVCLFASQKLDAVVDVAAYFPA